MSQRNQKLHLEQLHTKYTSTLEEGDYVPYFTYGNGQSIQTSAGSPILFVIIDTANPKYFRTDINTYIICQYCSINNRNIIVNSDLHRLFPNNKYVLLTPNLKIERIWELSATIDLKCIQPCEPPIIVVPNVITKQMKDELILFHNTSNKKNLELKGSKNRSHVFVDNRKLDDKLTKSLFPELKKVYNIDVTHRENYKLCAYDSEYGGKFHAHRDSVYPYSHRRYAMSLILNEDYEGGGIVFPEYNDTVYKPPSCSALIFPTPLYHQVLEVTGGVRYVVISFLFGDAEGERKNNPGYKIGVTRDQRNLMIEDIGPQ